MSSHVIPGASPDTPPELQAAPSEFPCSAVQARFWLGEQMEPGSALNVAVRWQLNGDIDRDRIEAAFRGTVLRHEILRTTFHGVDGVPVQRVQPSVAITVPEIDLSTMPDAEREARALNLAQAEAHVPFDLLSAPLLRVTLLRLAPTRAVLLLTAHHLVCDGWSVGVIAREMGLRYAGQATGTLPALPLQYADYALWEAEFRRAGGLAAEEEYWRAQLAGLRRFEVRPDHPRRAASAGGSHIHSILLPRAVTDTLQDLARQQAATLFAAALSGLSVLLHRYAAAAEVVIGTQVAGREQVELEHLVGPFINTLALRIDLSGNPTFAEHLRQVRDTVRNALAHQRLPIDNVVSILRPRREAGRDPLFSVNFILQRSFIANAAYGGMALTDLPSVSSGALYDLNFFMVERADGWRLSCEYDTGLFEEATAERLLTTLGRLLAAVGGDPRRAVSDYDLLDPAERKALLDAAGRMPLPQMVVEQLPAPARRGARAYVVEPGGQLAMLGAVGELWTDAVDPGAPDLPLGEMLRFVADPFDPEPRRRLYRTGVLVRLRPEGSLEVLAAPPHRHVVSTPAKPPARTSARLATEGRLAAIWAAVLGIPQVDRDVSFFDQGGHSLLAARMLARVEASFGQRLPLASLFRAPTVRAFAELLEGEAGRVGEFEAVPINAHGSRTPIFAINNTGLFHPLSRDLGPDQPFFSLCALDAVRPEEWVPQDFETVATRYVDILRRVQPHGPYILLGLCVAGCIAFEMAQQLARQGEPVPLLVLVDAWSPGYLDGMSRRDAALADLSYRLQDFSGEVRKLARGQLGVWDFIAQRGPAKSLRHWFLGRAKMAGRLQSVTLNPYSAWYQTHLEAAASRYRPQPFPGFIQVFHRPDQPSGRFLDRTFGWGRLALGGIDVQAVPGNHLSIFEEPGAGLMAQHLSRAIDGIGKWSAPGDGDRSGP